MKTELEHWIDLINYDNEQVNDMKKKKDSYIKKFLTTAFSRIQECGAIEVVNWRIEKNKIVFAIILYKQYTITIRHHENYKPERSS